ncbi:MAG TPA: TIGR03435 family protein [Acidobacteriaceae bacterium]|nr:TIGR03435 family protein [Acidobacteriaceae bacterium]
MPGRPPEWVRRNMKDGRPPGVISMPGPDRVRMSSRSLLDLISSAYSVRNIRVSGPVWMSDQEFDIEAKVPEGTPKQDLNGMLQSLLEERFGLKAHRNSQIRQGFALVVGKDGSKLKPTPAQSPSKQEVLAQQAQILKEALEANRAGGTLVSGSMTTEHLAFRLEQLVGAPVVDETGLSGEYSVTINTANDSVFGGVEKLGLKLQPGKVNIDMVVVDQVSKMPTAN